MMRLNYFFLAGLTLSTISLDPAQSSATPATPSTSESAIFDWRKAAQEDVEAAYDIYRENHPGWFNPQDPKFRTQLKRARAVGLKNAKIAHNASGYQRALSMFNAEMNDGHAVAFPKGKTDLGALTWAEFLPAWRGDALFVHDIGENTPAPVESRIESCDGEPIRTVMRRSLLSTGFRPNDAGHWWYYATSSFLFRAQNDAPRPKRCLFILPNGSRITANLKWRDVEEKATMTLVNSIRRGERTPVGLTEPRPGIFLIGLSDFQPNEETIDRYRAMFEEISQRRDELSRARAIVLDLRYNNGGSSAWPDDLAKILWGADHYKSRLGGYNAQAEIWWRASQENHTYITQMIERLAGEGHQDIANSLATIAIGVNDAIIKNKPYYIEKNENKDDNKFDPATAPATNPITAPIYVINDGSCASACLDAMDYFTQFDNVIRIGAPTASDTVYMEVRVVDLPSGKGQLAVPIKSYAGRKRASGAVYQPDIPMTDLDWSTKNFLDHIEVDAAKHAKSKS